MSGEPSRPTSRPAPATTPTGVDSNERGDDESRHRWDAHASEIERLNQQDPHAGVAYAEAWLADERGGEGRAHALRAVAYALRFAGVYDRAEPRFVEAEAAFTALGLDDDAARTRIGHVEALRYLGRYDEAIALARHNLEYLESRGPELGGDAARQRVNLGLVLWRRGDLEGALACFREALAFGRRVKGQRIVAAAASINIGLVLTELGRYGEALKASRFAAAECRALDARERLATVQMNLGLLHISRGEYGDALQELLASRALCEELGHEQKRAAVDLDLTRAYQALSLDAEAAEACEHAIETLRRLDLPFELATALLLAGQVAERRGDLPSARRELAEARALFGRIGNAVWETIATLAGLRLAVAEAGRSALPALLDETRAVAARLADLGAPEHAAAGYLLVADLEARLGRADAAQAGLRAALDLGRQLGSDVVLYQANLAEGLLLEAGAPDAARGSFERAVEHLERLRARARADDLKLAVVGQGINLYERIAQLLLGPAGAPYDAPAAGSVDRAGEPRTRPGHGRSVREASHWETSAREAFRWLERGKSRGLLEDAQADQRHTASASPRLRRARERVAELRARLNAAYGARFAIDAVPARVGTTVQDDLERLERDLGKATRELQILMRADGALDLTALVDVERVQAVLDGSACLLEFVVLGDEVSCFVIRRDRFVVRRAIAARQDVEKALGWFWFHIRKGTYGAEFLRTNHQTLSRAVNQALRQLGDLLLAPLADLLVGARHLVVVPHSLLHGVPLHALAYGEGILLDALTVSYAPSAAVFAAAAARPPLPVERLLIVAPDIPDLPWVQEEGRRIAERFPDALLLSGSEATLARVRREAVERDTLHLATHGVFRADNPTYSALELADGWLSVGELAELSRGRGMICLSACHTGMSGVGPGDELLGLTRAVLGAGVGALVASLWAANDDTAPAYMEAFYAGLRAGQSRAASLRAAALGLRRRESHPYFWAPFILVGAP